MEALKLNRQDYIEALQQVNEASAQGAYLARFEISLPDGINTANTLEICRVIQEPTMDARIHLMRVCLRGHNVEVKCPNGEVEKFCMSNIDDNLEAFPLFVKEPLALLAISDAIYGHILKKSVRLSKPRTAAAKTE
jgi:hypothetical protein